MFEEAKRIGGEIEIALPQACFSLRPGSFDVGVLLLLPQLLSELLDEAVPVVGWAEAVPAQRGSLSQGEATLGTG